MQTSDTPNLQPSDFTDCHSYFDILLSKASTDPDGVAYQFLKSDSSDTVVLTHQGLLDQVHNLVRHTQSRIQRGDRVIIPMPSCAEFVVAFFACQALGAISVPVPAPSRNRDNVRLDNILADATPSAVMTLQSVVDIIRVDSGSSDALQSLHLVAVDSLVDTPPQEKLQQREQRFDDIAFLQYTSGSTGEPKGVSVSNINLLENAAVQKRVLVPPGRNVGFSWVPLFHDLGLIGGILLPIYSGFPVCILPPAAFLMQPLRWLKLLTEYGVTITSGPNFALEICAQKAQAGASLDGIDLSSLKVLLCGAEPIQSETVDKFEKTFSSLGFSRSALCPVYGLAEVTLFAAGKQHDQRYVSTSFDRDSIATAGELVQAVTGNNAIQIISCGSAALPTVIVNPNTKERMEDGVVGEIWVSGSSVASKGYWQNKQKTQEIFQNRLANDHCVEDYLKTGDLGFIYEDQLYVTGRINDLIIIRGKNIYPQDVERLASGADESLSSGLAAAFTAPVNGVEQLVVVVEVSRHGLKQLKDADKVNNVIAQIQQAVAQETDVNPSAICLIKPTQLQRTSSGKIRRAANRAAWLDSQFNVVHHWQVSGAQNENTHKDEPLLLTRQQHEDWIVQRLSERCSMNVRDIALDQPFVNFGLDSVAAVELVEALRNRSAYAQELELTALWDYPTVSALVAYLCTEKPSDNTLSGKQNNSADESDNDMEDEISKLKLLLE